MLAVKSTVYPDGFRITWVSGMPKHPELMMDSHFITGGHCMFITLFSILKALTR
jgi:hypothetical protein